MTKVLGSKLSRLWEHINTVLVPRQATVTASGGYTTVNLQNSVTPTPNTLVSFNIPNHEIIGGKIDTIAVATDIGAAVSDIIIPNSGWTIDYAGVIQYGNVVSLGINATYSSDISINATGNITNIKIGQLVERFRPWMATNWQSFGDNAGFASGIIYGGLHTTEPGSIFLCAMDGRGTTYTVTAGSIIHIRATLILQGSYTMDPYVIGTTVTNTVPISAGQNIELDNDTTNDVLTISTSDTPTFNQIDLTSTNGNTTKIQTSNNDDLLLDVYDSTDTPVYRLYFSHYGNLARQEWNGSTLGDADYYIPISQLASRFSTTSFDITPGSIAAGGAKFSSASCARTGYTPIGISGWYLNGIASLQVYCCRLDGTDVQYGIRNPNTSASSSTGKLSVQVIYVKNT